MALAGTSAIPQTQGLGGGGKRRGIGFLTALWGRG